MGGIAILSHWHTGSSLFARTLQICGMETGNENTNWKKEICEANCEHAALNTIGNELVLEKIDPIVAFKETKRILESYRNEAEKNNWEFYGVKITHVLHSKAWAVFKDIFDFVWGGGGRMLLILLQFGILLV